MSATRTLSPAASKSAAMAAEMSRYVASGPPWAPQHYDTGEPSYPIPDVPVTAVFLVLFIAFGAAHMTLFRRNMKRHHKFIPSAVTFGFCMSRIVTCVLRIASSYNQYNVRLGIANGVFNRAGVLILFIINLFYTQRLLRYRHPKFGWTAPVNYLPVGGIALAVFTISMVIVVLVQSFYTLNPHTQTIDHHFVLYGVTCFLFISVLPIPLLAISHIVPSKPEERDHFGKGSYAVKAFIVIVAALLLTLGAAFRCVLTYLPAKSNMTDPRPWYDKTACFYIFYFGVEILVLALYLIGRVDQRFYVPDGAKGPGSYSAGAAKDMAVNSDGIEDKAVVDA